MAESERDNASETLCCIYCLASWRISHQLYRIVSWCPIVSRNGSSDCISGWQLLLIFLLLFDTLPQNKYSPDCGWWSDVKVGSRYPFGTSELPIKKKVQVHQRFLFMPGNGDRRAVSSYPRANSDQYKFSKLA